MQRKFLAGQDSDPDVREAGYSDEDMSRYAEDVLEASGLPRDRLAVVTREVWSLRDIARERVNWCRHIQLIQDLGHASDSRTLYACDPVRYCYCERYRVHRKISAARTGESLSRHSRTTIARTARNGARRSIPCVRRE